MDFTFPEDVRHFRSELRNFLDKAWPPDMRRFAMNDSVVRDLDSDPATSFKRALGRAGYLGIGLPQEYGGRPGGTLHRFVLQSELAAAGAPLNATAIGIVAPMLVRYGQESLTRQLVPGITRGELDFALGYTESNAGSDLASLQTQARLDGDRYVISGEKVFSTAAHIADYYWVAARTEKTDKKHQGISLFVVPLDAPGISISPLYTMSGIRTNVVHIDNVEVPVDHRVGDEGEGWRIIGEALDGERFAVMMVAPVIRAYQAVLEYCRCATRAGKRLLDDHAVASELVVLHSAIVAAYLNSVGIAWGTDRGESGSHDASALKVEVTELRLALSTFALDVLGTHGQLTPEDKAAPAFGELERMYRHAVITLFTGGANAVQRDLIARHGLGLGRQM